jgi:DNA-binding beta-propeller fold protein YncE
VILDESSSMLRIITGVPGATNTGRVMGGVKVRRAAVSRKNDYALAVTADSSEVLLIRNLSDTESVIYLPGVYTGGDALALSPDESAAVVFSAAESRLQFIAGLPLTPSVEFEAETSIAAGMSLTSVGVGHQGQILAGFSNGADGSLILFSRQIPSGRMIRQAGIPSAIAFSSQDDHAVIADRGWNDILVVHDVSTNATPIQLATSADGISSPAAVSLSADGLTAYVANAGANSVSLIQLAGGAARSFPCDCSAQRMQALGGNSLFALTERADEPIVLLDAADSDPKFVVVPPARVLVPIQLILP